MQKRLHKIWTITHCHSRHENSCFYCFFQNKLRGGMWHLLLLFGICTRHFVFLSGHAPRRAQTLANMQHIVTLPVPFVYREQQRDNTLHQTCQLSLILSIFSQVPRVHGNTAPPVMDHLARHKQQNSTFLNISQANKSPLNILPCDVKQCFGSGK